MQTTIGQLTLAFTESLPTAIAARAVVGLGAASARALIQGTALAVPWVLVGAGVIAGLLTNALGALLPAISTVREQPLRALRSR